MLLSVVTVTKMQWTRVALIISHNFYVKQKSTAIRKSNDVQRTSTETLATTGVAVTVANCWTLCCMFVQCYLVYVNHCYLLNNFTLCMNNITLWCLCVPVMSGSSIQNRIMRVCTSVLYLL